jgi:hypothetical protein
MYNFSFLYIYSITVAITVATTVAISVAITVAICVATAFAIRVATTVAIPITSPPLMRNLLGPVVMAICKSLAIQSYAGPGTCIGKQISKK